VTAGEADRLTVETSGLFDAKAYLTIAPPEAAADPIGHFLTQGWRLKLDPHPGFSTADYLRDNPDVATAGVNPLIHYLRDGRAEGRPIHPSTLIDTSLDRVPPPVAPSPEEWTSLASRQRVQGDPVVNIVVPVYRDRDATLRCLYSVLAAPVTTPFELIVVDDHSPEPRLSEELRELAGRGLFTLLRTPENLGFVGATNMGLELRPGRDAVLLNSDTEVHNDWLDRLHRAAWRGGRVGTVTPLSSNATICSYPRFVADNPFQLGISDAELDLLAAEVNAGQEVELPTGVGFCMYIRRDCLAEVGLLDRETFGHGYGEENDLCRRIAEAGWRNILAPDVFVRHYGAASFGASKAERVREALETMEKRHPGYGRMIAEFVAQDPIRPFRRALDLARARRMFATGATLLVTHDWGGGTEQHVQELAAGLRRDGQGVVVLRPERNGTLRVQMPGAANLPNLPVLDLRGPASCLGASFREMGAARVHVHHLAGFPEDAADNLRLACASAGLPLYITIHDYTPACPRINLIDRTGRWCGEPPADQCNECIAIDGSPFGHPPVDLWRERYARLLNAARRVFVPDADVSERMARWFPDARYAVRPHPEVMSPPAPPRERREGLPRTVVVLGAIGPHKGSGLLLECARVAAQRGDALRFVVVGYTDNDAAFASLGNVRITGRYAQADTQKVLAEAEGDLAFFPAVWPETYSYTLSATLAAGLYPVTFDFGAIAARLRRLGWGEFLPVSMMLDPEAIVSRLATLEPAPRPELSAAPVPASLLDYYYGEE
jgi:GT2 family glycosyltransferase/glycosyltransferase involved in cell wall biosynthesis